MSHEDRMNSQNIFLETSPSLFLHEWTKKFREGLPAPRPEEPSAGLPQAWIDEFYPLSSPFEALEPAEEPFTTSEHTVLETLSNRRSVRTYADRPCTVAELAHFLTLCYPPQVIRPDYRPEARPHEGLKRCTGHVTGCRLLLLLLNVTGIERGAYYFDERRRHLRHVRLEDPRPVMERNSFQAEFTLAPVIVLTAGSLADYLGRYGDRGYRYMLIDTGILIQRMYLAASYLGMSGCTTGSLIQGRFDRWLGLDGYKGTVLKAFALGHRVGELSDNG
jgi:SagB-type dehydrogenase family enzyme